jgi:tetrapyrrole methylase family protein/MazG family protein
VLDALINEAQLRWGLDVSLGVAVIAAESLAATPLEPGRPVIIVPSAMLRSAPRRSAATSPAGDGTAVEDAPVVAAPPAVLPGRHGHPAADPVAVLRRLYPGTHPVGRFGAADGVTVDDLAPAHLAAAVYLAPVPADVRQASPWALPWISARLRAPDGCPWDREQTHESLRRHLLEEAYEVYDALGDGATPALAGELGDLLLQVVLHAQLAAEAGVFDMTDVYEAIGSKIIRRHPHVFGDAKAATAGDVNRQWEQIKSAERTAAAAGAARDASGAAEPRSPGDGTGPAAAPVAKSALDGISRSMPALAASQEMQERAANLGYDWPTVDGIVAKVHEELEELLAASTPEARREELGDLLMVVVNLGRRHGVEAETALRSGNEKLRRRFRSVERQAEERGVALRDMDFATLDQLWDAAKAEERES